MPDKELVRLKEEYEAIKKEHDAVFQPSESDKAMLALEAKKKALDEHIAEQERRLKEGDLKSPGARMNRPGEPGIEELLQKRDALNLQMAEARKSATPHTTPEERALQAAMSGVERSITDLEARIRNNDLAPRMTKRLSTPELESIRARRDALRDQLQKMRDLANPKKTPEERALQATKTRLTNRIADLLIGTRFIKAHAG